MDEEEKQGMEEFYRAVKAKEPSTIVKILGYGFSVVAFVAMLVVVLRYYDFFATLYSLAIFILILISLFLAFVILPIHTYKDMKKQIRKLENENEELRRELRNNGS